MSSDIDTWRACFEAGKRSYEKGSYAEAESVIKHSLARAESCLEKDEAVIATMLGVLGNIKRECGEFPEAKRSYLNAISLFARFKQVEGECEVWKDLSLSYCLEGDFRAAVDAETNFLDLSDRVFGVDSPQSHESIARLAAMCMVLQDFKSALVYLEQYRLGKMIQLGSDSEAYARILIAVARTYYELEMYAEAEARYREALRIMEMRPKCAAASGIRNELGLSMCAQNRQEEARVICTKAACHRTDSGNLTQWGMLNDLADVYCAQGRFDDARPLCESAFAMRRGSATDTPGERLALFSKVMDLLSGNQPLTRINRQIAEYMRQAAA